MNNKEIKNVLRHVFHFYDKHLGDETNMIPWKELNEACGKILQLVEQEPKWIPVSERLPKNIEPVNITWVNRNPEKYYEEIKDKPYTATGHYCKGKWYWYSSTCQDYLENYGRCDVDEIDKDIEITAWMPLPQSYTKSEE